MNWLMLGRAGDIMHVLPAIKYEYDKTDEMQRLFVAAEFQPLVVRCEYLREQMLPVDWPDVGQAIAMIDLKYGPINLMNCSVYGRNWHFTRRESNYQRDIWRNTGCPHEFNTLPLVFDNRDYNAELSLFCTLDALNHKRKPYIVTHFGGVSSPFPYAPIISQAIQAIRPDMHVIDITHIRAPALPDFLTLLERSHGLVCSDSAFLHLSRAVPTLRTLAFITDGHKPWNRSEPHSGVIWHCLYSDCMNEHDSFSKALKTL